MPVNAKLLMGVCGISTPNACHSFEKIQKLLAMDGCQASISQIASYLGRSGKKPNDVIAMSELERRDWFGRCLDEVYHLRLS